jgi:hypothetical protein
MHGHRGHETDHNIFHQAVDANHDATGAGFPGKGDGKFGLRPSVVSFVIERVRFGLFFFVCCWSLSARAVDLPLGADRDASLFKVPADNSNGGGPGIFVGTNGMSSARRGLISFNLGAIPPGATITGVQLTLTTGQAAGGAATIGIYELTSSWGEGSNAPATMIAMTGAGQPAQAGDATWNARFYSATTPTLWSNPGGDFDPLPSASLTIADATLNLPHTWPSTPQLVADVQEWLDHPATNQGWILKSADETSAANNTVFGFYSSEWPDQTVGPKLLITYSIPEPAAGVLAGPALLSLLGMRVLRRGAWQFNRRHAEES